MKSMRIVWMWYVRGKTRRVLCEMLLLPGVMCEYYDDNDDSDNNIIVKSSRCRRTGLTGMSTAGFCTRTWPSWARFDKRFGLGSSSNGFGAGVR